MSFRADNLPFDCVRLMSKQDRIITRRDFLKRSPSALAAIGAITASCKSNKDNGYDYKLPDGRSINPKPSSWWRENGFIVQDSLDTRRITEGVIRACINGVWQEFNIVELPGQFVTWSLSMRIARLERMLSFGGLDPRDLAGSHNACVATYGGPSRDSAVSLNTAYKGMGFAVYPDKIAQISRNINEEKMRIEKDLRGDPTAQLKAKVRFLAEFYSDSSIFDRTKQVSLELFTSPDFHTHTFLNMMANPIASASFLAFPTFEIRAVPQLLHPKNPGLSKIEKDLLVYTNTTHDFIHSGFGKHMACVYHVIELFDDTPNDKSKGRRII